MSQQLNHRRYKHNEHSPHLEQLSWYISIASQMKQYLIQMMTNQTIPNQNETVFTLPTEQIPEGLIVGQVGQTITKPSNPIQKVEIILSPTIHNPNTSAHIITKP